MTNRTLVWHNKNKNLCGYIFKLEILFILMLWMWIIHNHHQCLSVLQNQFELIVQLLLDLYHTLNLVG